jgi:hypothetical protein
METNFKNWKKTAEGKYTFYKQEQKIGQLEIQTNLFKRRAIIDLDNQKYTLKHTGFWKSNLEIVDTQNHVVLKTYQEKWYSSSSIIELEGKKLKLIIRNNPLAEYAIVDGEKEILAYGLDFKDGKAITRIQSAIHTQSYLLDFYLWYLFVPIAQENMGEDFTFLLLATA